MSLSRFLSRLYSLPNESNRYAAMEGLRAYAVLTVFLVHFFGTYARVLENTNLQGLAMGKVDSLGEMLMLYFYRSHYGVDIFFLLSGFLIFRMISRPGFQYGQFMSNRVRRIYPAFLLSMGLAIGTKLLIDPEFELDPGQILKNLLFLNGIPGQSFVTAYNHPTWSLFFEFTFYLALPVIVFGLKINSALRLAALAAVWLIFCHFLHPAYSRYAMFYAGAILATARNEDLKRLSANIPDVAVLLIYLCGTFYYLFQKNFRVFIPLYAVVTSLLFINTVYGGGFLNRLFSLQWLRYLGNLSYSFYLVHVIAIKVTFNMIVSPLSLTSSPLTLATTLISSFVLTVMFATLIFALVEKPYFRKR